MSLGGPPDCAQGLFGAVQAYLLLKCKVPKPEQLKAQSQGFIEAIVLHPDLHNLQTSG